MARLTRVDEGQTKIKNVPIAVTADGFWCCPSPVVLQKTLRTQNSLNKPKPASPPKKPPIPKKQTPPNEKIPSLLKPGITFENSNKLGIEPSGPGTAISTERTPRAKVENLPRKVAIEFGVTGTSDMKVILFGKKGFCVKLSLHRNVLVENSSFFAKKLADKQPGSCLEIDECEDVEIYVETMGLMYCKDMKQRLLKQNVSRVLRVLKVAELLGFNSCLMSCLEYLEAVPWVGEEEEKVISSVLRLQEEGFGVAPVLRRVSPIISKPPKDTLSHIIELVLKSTEEKGRREMKSIVLKLLRENNNLPRCTGPAELCYETIYSSCRSCLNSLLAMFQKVSEPGFTDKSLDSKEPVLKQLVLDSDNLSWLLEILVSRQAADDFAEMWAQQEELASLHAKLPTMTRHRVSLITARLFVCIGKGELLPPKGTRQSLLQIWLQPLMNDYSWLHHGCRSLDRKVVDEGIGRTILTLPLEEQQNILLFWLGSFLKGGDNCPNLQRAFEVWWRRTFVRPYVEMGGILFELDGSTTSI